MLIIYVIYSKLYKLTNYPIKNTEFAFQVINEARDFILHIKDPLHKGHVFSPVSIHLTHIVNTPLLIFFL